MKGHVYKEYVIVRKDLVYWTSSSSNIFASKYMMSCS